MDEENGAFARLAQQFRSLPGIGRKTASRLALALLDAPPERAETFAATIREARAVVRRCEVCGNLCEEEICPVCADESRDHTVVCVVQDIRAVAAFERVREYRGVYHVLGGALSPMDGIGPDKLNIASLASRVADGGVREVILATNPTIEGESTAMFLMRLLTPSGVKLTRLAYGIPVGGDLEYADEITLGRAIEGRRTME